MPQEVLLDTWMLAPDDLEGELSNLWVLPPDVPLTVPAGVRAVLQFNLDWRSESMMPSVRGLRDRCTGAAHRPAPSRPF